MKIFYIDLFSGAGGTTTGIHLTDNEDIEVVACVNHDEKATASHKANHPNCLHFIEDVRDMKVVIALANLVRELRKKYPDCIIIIWASLECTNYSKAKGGLPRDADSRTLAHALYLYIENLDPDYLMIENVREFMSWGPLDEKGKPISKKNGTDYLRWVERIRGSGYDYDWRLLNSANYGAYTSRERYFGQFAKDGLPIAWPEPTHAKNPIKGGLYASLKKWKPVKDVLDLDDEGVSIFERKKQLVDATLNRIYAGLIKFVAGGEKEFMIKYNSMNQNGKYKAPSMEDPCPVVSTQSRLGVAFIQKNFSGKPMGKVNSLEVPAGSITTIDNKSLVQPQFLTAYYSGGGQLNSIDNPCPVIPTKDRFQKVKPQFLLDYQYKSGAHDLDNPSPTLLTKDKFAKVKPTFMVNNYTSGGQHSSTNDPCSTITSVPKQNIAFIDQQYGQSKPVGTDNPAATLTANPKLNVVSAKPWLMSTNFSNVGNDLKGPSPVITANRKWHYLMNPQFRNKGTSLEKPCFTLIARMDKRPPYVIGAITGDYGIIINEHDSEAMIRIKEFMAMYGIIDIKMRMLKVLELLKIQGFPDDYILEGTQAVKKKFIGNAVHPKVAKKLAEANSQALLNRETAIAV